MFPPLVERWRPLAAAAVSRAASRYGVTVPVDVVLAVLQKESSGDPWAKRTEPDGRVSRGLMQVLTGTAAELGFPNPVALFQPATGIEAGVRYLAKQLARYRNVRHAVAAYNAGSVRFDAQERYRNQSYVDRVFQFLREATGVRASAPPSAPAPFRWSAGVVLGGLAAVAVLAAIAGSKGGRRAA